MKVSVCIPTFNQAPYIEHTIRSAVNQTIAPFEVVVSDDCSSDETADILQRLSSEISILRVIRQPINLGMNRNTDFCLRQGTGEFIVKLDSDDYLAPTYIEKLGKLLLSNSNAGYAHADVQEIDQDGVFTQFRRLGRKTGYQDADCALRSSVKGYRVAANIIMFRKAALQRVGYISSQTNFAEDFHLSARLAASGFGNVYLKEVLSYYRVWSDAGRVRQRRKMDEIIGLRSVFEEVIEPGFKKRNWDIKRVRNSRRKFACQHSDCLSWDIYSSMEKAELAGELRKLSADRQAEFVAWLYLKGYGKLVSFATAVKRIPKKIVKNSLAQLRS